MNDKVIGSSLYVCSLALWWGCSRKRTVSNKVKETNVKHISLVDFASTKCGVYIDASRKLFFERHQALIQDLVNGNLQNRNRFRELLLGVKAIGKTFMCQVLKSYMEYMYPEVLTVYITYDECVKTISSKVCEEMVRQKRVSKNMIASILVNESIYERIEDMTTFLKTYNIRVLLLIDEFHFVYKKEPIIGVDIVKELSIISGSTSGYIHCIVTGSSSCLRALAFAKLPIEDACNYPSYTGIDLNSTKLQPKWIYPLYDANEFRQFVKSRNITEGDIAMRYIFSGGRPGLVIEPVTIDEIPYSLRVKHLLTDTTPHSALLRGLFDCMESYNTDSRYDNDDDLDKLASDIVPVSEHVLLNRMRESNNHMGEGDFEKTLYQLVDEGLMIVTYSTHVRMIRVACSYAYLQLQQMRLTSLTWKEAAALKMPQGYFAEIAEDVAFRFIKAKSKTLFGVELRRLDSTILNFGTSKTPRYAIGCPIFNFNQSRFDDISGCIHKELLDGKDQCGGDGILLVKLPNGHINLLRFQLKLGRGSYEGEDIIAVQEDMFKRGEKIEEFVSQKYCISKHSCYLITTKFPKNWISNENNIPTSSQNIARTFEVIGPKQLSDANVWTKDVKRLGQPYASNTKTNRSIVL